jgi:hypothetical protein
VPAFSLALVRFRGRDGHSLLLLSGVHEPQRDRLDIVLVRGLAGLYAW